VVMLRRQVMEPKKRLMLAQCILQFYATGDIGPDMEEGPPPGWTEEEVLLFTAQYEQFIMEADPVHMLLPLLPLEEEL